MQVLRSLLAGGVMLASVGVASAPTLLTEEQLDGVTAGNIVGVNTSNFFNAPTAFNLSQLEAVLAFFEN